MKAIVLTVVLAGAATSTPATLTEDGRTKVRAVLGEYEQIRAKLVADDGDVAQRAQRLARAARAAHDAAPASLRPHLTGIAAHARELAAAPASDLARLRREFGDVSRHVVALLRAEPALAQGLFVFECPMAEGYRKWVQRSAEISNPYMGRRMPRCGRRSAP